MDFTEIAGYRIVRQLGAGGMGQVFLAEHPRLPRMDALKLLDAGVTRSVDFKARFVREADMLAKLSHPNIVTPYDRGEFEGRLWIAMEYVDGTDAAELVKEHGPLDVDLVLQLVDGAGAALDYVWRKERVTHRDVKPANILVGIDDGRVESVKLADFGIAKAVGEGAALTSTGTMVGSMDYVSPEAIEGHDLDNRSDIYSLGCTAFHLLTGDRPFVGNSLTAILSAHLTQAPRSVGDVAPQLPIALDSVFARVLAKDPADRYGSCADFISDLTSAARDDVVPAYADTMAAPTMLAPTQNRPTRSVGGQSRLSRVLSIVAAVLAVLVMAGVVYGVYLTRSDGADDAATTATSSTVQTSTETTRPVRTITKTVTPRPTPTTTWTPDETPTTATVQQPYAGMPCGPEDYGKVSDDGTLHCSAVGMVPSWRDRTYMDHAPVTLGSTCSEPGVRAQVVQTDGVATCKQSSSGGYAWQY